MEKRQRGRAIIFTNDKMIVMYREFNDRKFYTFPGGGLEQNESITECVVREVFEEYGITIQPVKELYLYENDKSIEHFFLCEWVSGDFGTGTGEEFQKNSSQGVYVPMLIDTKDLQNITLMPPQVANELTNDIKTFGYSLGNTLKKIIVE